MRACQNALDTLLREQRQHRADRIVSQQLAPSLGVSPLPVTTPSSEMMTGINLLRARALPYRAPVSEQYRLVVAADLRVAEAEAALEKARVRVEMARALASLPADAGDEDIVDLSEPYDAALHGHPPPAAAALTAFRPPSR